MSSEAPSRDLPDEPSSESGSPGPSPTHLILAVVAALALGFAAGRLSGGDSSAAGPAGLEQTRKPPSDSSVVVADVAGQTLTLEQFLARWDQLSTDTKRFHEQRGGPQHFLEEIAEEFLLSEVAVQRGYAARTEVLEMVRRDVNRTLVRPLLADEVREKAIPERELVSRFELRKDEWARPARVRLRELRITPEPSPPGIDAEEDAVTAEEAEAKARSLHARLEAGESFDELAGRFSEAPSARYGGLIGWVVEGRFALEYEEAALQMAAGELSEPLPMEDGGWVILLAEEREEAEEVAFEDHREELLQDLLEEDPGAVSRRYRVFVEELKRSHEYRTDSAPVLEALNAASAG